MHVFIEYKKSDEAYPKKILLKFREKLYHFSGYKAQTTCWICLPLLSHFNSSNPVAVHYLECLSWLPFLTWVNTPKYTQLRQLQEKSFQQGTQGAARGFYYIWRAHRWKLTRSSHEGRRNTSRNMLSSPILSGVSNLRFN